MPTRSAEQTTLVTRGAAWTREAINANPRSDAIRATAHRAAGSVRRRKVSIRPSTE
jgi:hypothetical protein